MIYTTVIAAENAATTENENSSMMNKMTPYALGALGGYLITASMAGIAKRFNINWLEGITTFSGSQQETLNIRKLFPLQHKKYLEKTQAEEVAGPENNYEKTERGNQDLKEKTRKEVKENFDKL